MDTSVDFKKVISDVKEAYSIEDYIESDGIALSQSGATKYKGLCPFHSEKTPSFTVDVQFQSYYCFGCKAHGDIISYVSDRENLTFMEALTSLAEDKNISIELDGDVQPKVDLTSLREIIADTAKFFVRNFKKLPEDHAAKKQILDRGLELDSMTYGYAPEKRTALYDFLKSKNYSDELIFQTGVCREPKNGGKPFDFWSGRLMFIISDIQKRPIGFSGRKIFESDTYSKYVNSSDSPIFDKSKALFNLPKAKDKAGKDKRVFIVEGQFDVAALSSSDLSNTVAVSGTSFTEHQSKTLQRITHNGELVFCLDGDEPGIKAALRVFEKHPDIHDSLFAVLFPEGQDPCDYRKENSSEELKRFVTDKKVSLVDFVLENIRRNSDLSSSIGRTRYVQEAAEKISFIKNRVLLENSVREVALHSKSSFDSVMTEVEKAIEKNKNRPVSRDRNENEEKISSEEERRELLEGNIEDSFIEKQKELIEAFNKDRIYKISSKILSFALLDQNSLKIVIKNRESLPKRLLPFVKDSLEVMKKANKERERISFFPEDFKYSLISEYLMSSDNIPLSHLMSAENIQSQVLFLFDLLEKETIKRKKKIIQSRIDETLFSGRKEVSLEEFEKIMKAEQGEIEALNESYLTNDGGD